jgi:hypothetical protein
MRRDSDTPFSFLSAASLWQAGCIVFCAGVRQKENNNDADGNVRDCLAESETPSTSATLGAPQEGFSNESLLASGIDFHPSGIVLGHDI